MKKIDFRIYIIIVLTIILAIMCYFYFKDDSNSFSRFNYNSQTNSTTTDSSSVTTTTQVASALTEEIPLRTGYYFQEMLVSDNVVVKKGTKMIKYTNGKYLTAPYDLVITDYSVPDSKKICNSTHYLTISAFNVLSSQFRVDETKIDNIYIGKTVKVRIPALNDKEIEGIVTDITNTASNGKFTATVEYDNDGTIKIGMTVKITY